MVSLSLKSIRVMIAFILAMVSLPHSLGHTQILNPEYSCGGYGYNNCHGTTGWGVPSGTAGAGNTILVRPLQMTCTAVGCQRDNFIANKLWLTGTPGNSFIEVGYRTEVVGGLDDISPERVAAVYFWADQRPAYPSYAYHVIAEVPPIDHHRQAHLSIIKDFGYADEWDVYITSFSRYSLDRSTDNTMASTVMVYGTQLSGTTGANMIEGQHFTNNSWRDSGGFWHLQSVDGGLSQNNGPITRGWIVRPSVSPGGDFFTRCC